MPPVAVAAAPRAAAAAPARSAGSTQRLSTASAPPAPKGSVVASKLRGVAPGRTPSHYALEQPYVSDTTGPGHHSLRGSRPIKAPATFASVRYASEEKEGGATVVHASDPSTRDANPVHTFIHTDVAPPPAWTGGSRAEVMRSATHVAYPTKDARSTQSLAGAGKGGRIAAAQEASSSWVPRPADVVTDPTPLQNLAAARQMDLLQAARTLQAKSAAAQASADRLFEASAHSRYIANRAVQSAAPSAPLTSPFFLGADGSSGAIARDRPPPQARAGGAQTQREKRNRVGGNAAPPARPLSAASLSLRSSDAPTAGFNTKQTRDWSSDSSVRLVARGAGRTSDEFAATYSRVMGNDGRDGTSTAKGMAGASSATRDAMEAGRAGSAAGERSFTPVFLRKVHPSLHDNLQRAIFNNGAQFVDGIGTNGRNCAKFIPRAHDKDEQMTGTGTGMVGM